MAADPVTSCARQHTSALVAHTATAGDESAQQSLDDDRMQAAELLMQFGSKPGANKQPPLEADPQPVSSSTQHKTPPSTSASSVRHAPHFHFARATACTSCSPLAIESRSLPRARTNRTSNFKNWCHVLTRTQFPTPRAHHNNTRVCCRGKLRRNTAQLSPQCRAREATDLPNIPVGWSSSTLGARCRRTLDLQFSQSHSHSHSHSHSQSSSSSSSIFRPSLSNICSPSNRCSSSTAR
jgi:hypothetical protein